MARAIDANELEMFPYSEGAGTEEQIEDWIEQVGLSGDDTASRARNLCWKVIEGYINVVKTQPTLTPPNEWVSVDERLPPLGKNVLVYVYWHEHCGVYMGWSHNHGWIVFCGIESRPDMQVTHWMPLPEPPAKDGD